MLDWNAAAANCASPIVNSGYLSSAIGQSGYLSSAIGRSGYLSSAIGRSGYLSSAGGRSGYTLIGQFMTLMRHFQFPRTSCTVCLLQISWSVHLLCSRGQESSG